MQNTVRAPSSPPRFLRRFILVTGKGGVGKSTVTSALAVASARRGDKTLVCELNAHEQVSQLLGHEPVGSQVTELEPNLWSVNIRPDAAMQEYGVMKLRFTALYRLVFDNPLVSALVRFVPGLNDLLMLGKAFNHEREERGGQPVWDRIIIDAPATGHGLTFFQLPKIIRDAVPSGNMHRESDEMWRLLTDAERTAIHLVTLPEELPIQETKELHARLRDELELPVGTIFLNRMPVLSLDDGQQDQLRSMSTEPDSPELSTLWTAGKIRIAEHERALGFRGQLDSLALPVINLSRSHARHFGRREIEGLADEMERWTS